MPHGVGYGSTRTVHCRPASGVVTRGLSDGHFCNGKELIYFLYQKTGLSFLLWHTNICVIKCL